MGGNSSKSNKASRITEQDKAILQLKQMRDKLKRYQEKIELQLEKERELAKDLVKNGKIEYKNDNF
jgi:charged multivesicular body protein 6